MSLAFLFLTVFPLDACPKVSIAGGLSGAGVVVGLKDGYGYVLTAAHVLPYEGVEMRFRPGGCELAEWFPTDPPQVLHRWPGPDLALVRFRTESKLVQVRPLAAAGDRPKAFPAAVRSIGLNEDDTTTAWDDHVLAKRFVRKSAMSVAFFWETSRPPKPGRSGGPLLDANGRVIGICAATQDGRGYYAHHDEILAALAREGFGWLVPK